MHFIVLASANPEDETFWSGIPLHVIGSLRAAGHRVTSIGDLSPGVTLWGRIKGRLYRHLQGTNYVINRDPAVLKARASQANDLLQQQSGADAILFFYPPDAAYIRSALPKVVIHDATWHQLLDFYPGYERKHLARESIEGGYELDRLALENCDLAVYGSHWAAQSALKDYGVRPKKLTVQAFGANLAEAPRTADIESAIDRRGGGPCKLLFVGVEWYRKGGDEAVEIAEKLCERGLAVQLDVVGVDPKRPLPSFVRCHGYLSKKDPYGSSRLAALYADADFFVLPVRAECAGIVFCESAAFGLPVLTKAVGGVTEIIRDDSWGLALAPDAAPDRYAALIADIYRDRPSYKRKALAARRDFETRLNWQAFGTELCQSLGKVVGDTKPG
jgi:glycosyltransferase involved in cell wall biosynthesis